MENARYIAIASAVIFAGLFLLERWIPLRVNGQSLWRRLLVNLVVSAIALGIGVVLIRPSVGYFLERPADQVGLLNWFTLPQPIEIVIGFMLMDLAFYYWHLANHRISFLWRFHNVHHIDPDLDVSTAFRFHFGEMVFSVGFRVAQVAVIGLSPLTYLVYEFVFQANTLFHHSNVRLPIRMERLLNRVLVTPRMHGIHHSRVKAEVNSNFSVVLPWWDLMHRTLRLNVPQSQIVIGVPAYSKPEDNHLWNVLLMPFRKQRDYWGEGISGDQRVETVGEREAGTCEMPIRRMPERRLAE